MFKPTTHNLFFLTEINLLCCMFVYLYDEGNNKCGSTCSSILTILLTKTIVHPKQILIFFYIYFIVRERNYNV